MSKQTAVEWFSEVVAKMGYVSTNILEQAKEMEKEQMKEMYLKGIANYDPTFKIKESKGGDRKPKQDLEKEMFDLEQELDIPSSMRWHNSKPKQETLEEAALRLYPKFSHDPYNPLEDVLKDEREIFIEGAEWQAERMYSDMEEYSAFVLKSYKEGLPLLLAKEWFEQFKKKGGDK
jgi:hypothetical protein